MGPRRLLIVSSSRNAWIDSSDCGNGIRFRRSHSIPIRRPVEDDMDNMDHHLLNCASSRSGRAAAKDDATC